MDEKIVELPLEEYKRRFKEICKNLRVNVGEIIDPWMSEEERIEAIRKAWNPDLPPYFQVYGEEGLTIYKVKRGN